MDLSNQVEAVFKYLEGNKYSPLTINSYRACLNRIVADSRAIEAKNEFKFLKTLSLYKGGMPLPILSEWLGHTKLETTIIHYAKAYTTMKQKAVEKATSDLNPLRAKIPFKVNTDDERQLKMLYGVI
jgi:hypothetical protein